MFDNCALSDISPPTMSVIVVASSSQIEQGHPGNSLIFGNHRIKKFILADLQAEGGYFFDDRVGGVQ